MDYRTLNPTTEETLETFPYPSTAEVERSLEFARRAFSRWRRTSLDRRAFLLEAAADLLERKARELSRLMAVEMGKPLAEGEAEATKCARVCRYYAEHGAGFLAESPRQSDGSAAFVRQDPLGPVLAVMPWNFPFWQFFRFAAPGLMAGNTVVLKPAPNTPLCALRIVSLLEDAGFPDGVVQTLFLTDSQTAGVVTDSRVRGVTLTGSTRAGSEVGAVAGRALKPMVLELGGSDPFVVLSDADLAHAVSVGVTSRCLNSGQSCIAAKRFLVHRSRHEEFVEAFVSEMKKRVIGDPTVPEVTIGPLARKDLRDRLAAQVDRSVAAGAAALLCSPAPEGRGFFFPAIVLTGVGPDTPPAVEELFGPVATVMPFDDDDQAVAIANATRYGLGASVWTADVERGLRLAADLDAGAVFVNGLVKSDPRLPFGGFKDSGFGRELGREGILEFVNAKTVWVA